jgi:anti-sigma regulatory factor (Ser/Thr protein kinase)
MPLELASLLSCSGHQSSRWRRVFPGDTGQLTFVRRFVRSCLARPGPAEDAVLLTTELAANAIQHTASGRGGTFEVVVCQHVVTARISVTDGGAAPPPPPPPPPAAPPARPRPGPRGALARDWGHYGGPLGRTVWFELDTLA